MPVPALSKVAEAITRFDQVLQRVKLLRVLPGSRSVRFQLNLTLPTSPVFAVYNRSEGGTAALDFQQKPVNVGWSFIFVNTSFDSRLRGLRPERPYRYRITIPATRTSSEIILTGEFFTARREVTCQIDEILLTSGGSEDIFSGAPDLTFFTALYDGGEPRMRLTEQRVFGEIAAWNGHFKLPFGKNSDHVINPPDSIEPYIHAFEDDIGVFEGFDVGRGTPIQLQRSGPFDHDTDDGPFAGDSVRLELPEDEGEHDAFFTLDTSGRRIDYKANGRIKTTVFPPRDTGIRMRVERARTLTTLMRVSTVMKMKVGGSRWHVGLSGEQLLVGRRGSESRSADMVEILPIGSTGSALAIANADRTAHVFVASERGGVRSTTVENHGPNGRWADLGGPRLQSLSAVATTDGTHLVGLDEAGGLYYAHVGPDGARWRDLGTTAADAVVVADRRGRATVYGLSLEGRVWALGLNSPDVGNRTDLDGPRLAMLAAYESEGEPFLVGLDLLGRIHVRSVDDKGWSDMGPVDLFGLEMADRETLTR
jgi:hypothetical protein